MARQNESCNNDIDCNMIIMQTILTYNANYIKFRFIKALS
jgi:hypothetical protein